jgi:hypothetical protein
MFVPTTTTVSDAPVVQVKQIDQREAKLEAFFTLHKCPSPHHVTEYLNAADKYKLDYRLVPAISIIESQCGKHQPLSNWWGWNSARTGFTDVPSGIDFVTGQLANGKYYAGKSLEKKVTTYNSANPKYLSIIKALMSQIEQTK